MVWYFYVKDNNVIISDSSAGYSSVDFPLVFIFSALTPINVRFILVFVSSVV